jgi:hypothetical protein
VTVSLRRYGRSHGRRQLRSDQKLAAVTLRPPPGRSSRVRYAETVEHGSGISPAAVMLLCFLVVGVGFFLFTRFDNSDKNKK